MTEFDVESRAARPTPPQSIPPRPRPVRDDPRRFVDIDSMLLGGTRVDACSREAAFALVAERLTRSGGRPLGVVSANLDHIHHFGTRGEYAHILESVPQPWPARAHDWLVLVDGMPLVWAMRRLTGRRHEQVAGSQMLPEFLQLAAGCGARVGFLGGRPEMHARLRRKLVGEVPDLKVAGYWAPSRETLQDTDASAALADKIRRARVDLLVVGLGKPLQEVWFAEHGFTTGVKVGLAFGAAADFLSGDVRRAPQAVSDAGLEWLYRLAKEPRRLAHRYLVQGPPALWTLLTDSSRG